MTRLLAAGLFVVIAAGCAAPGLPLDPYVIVLGTAQDGGLPHVACTCPRCDAARRDPERRRLVASIAIVVPESGKRFLVDATPDLREQLDRIQSVDVRGTGGVNRTPVDGVLLTHAHVGHYLGLALFGFEAVHTSKLPVWATPRMTSFLTGNAPWNRLVSRGEIDLRELPPGVTLELAAGVRVTPYAVPHRDEDSDTVAFKIHGPRHTVFYAPDTDRWETWSETAREALASCGTALIDGTFYSLEELPGRDIAKIGHPLIVTSMDLYQERLGSGKFSVLFTHLNHSNRALEPGGPERRAILSRGFALAEDGQRLPL